MSKKINTLTILMLIVIVGLVTTTISLKKQNDDLKNDPAYQKVKTVKKTNALRQKVAKIMYIPKDTQAFIGTYDAKSSLKNNPFFKDAKDGDKYLIFSELGKAIIYRESENKIINSGPIAITSEKEKSGSKDTKTVESKNAEETSE